MPIYRQIEKRCSTLHNIKVNPVVSLLYVDSPLPLFKKTLFFLRFSVFMSHLRTILHLFSMKTHVLLHLNHLTFCNILFKNNYNPIPVLCVQNLAAVFFVFLLSPPRFFKIEVIATVTLMYEHNKYTAIRLNSVNSCTGHTWCPVLVSSPLLQFY